MERYVPKIRPVAWNIEELGKEERLSIKNRLVARITHSEDEYRAVLSYLHMKYPDLMDISYGDGKKFQWRYREFPNKIKAYDSVSKRDWDMYALVYYDLCRDMEPVAVGGSYLRETGAIRDPYTHDVIEGQLLNKHTTKIRCGHGYVLFVDPSYRRMGLSQSQWLTEAQLYRDSDIHYQKENQTYEALKVTLSLFHDQSKCHILSNRKLNMIHKGVNTKIIMDYFDDELVNQFLILPKGLYDFRKELDWTFLKRENLTIEELIEPWKELPKVTSYNSKINCQFSVNRDLYNSFASYCKQDGKNVKQMLTEYMQFIVNGQ